MKKLILACFLLPSICISGPRVETKKSAAELEKEKATQNPYPNDLGPQEIDARVKAYPSRFKEGYMLLKARCSQCHQPARPLNSRFVEPYVNDERIDDPEKRMSLKRAALAEWKKSSPEIFKDPTVWQPEADVWSRYVKRMMSKPGCKIDKPEGKAIWEFLVYDSNQRKLGKNAATWKAHRKKLVDAFKKKYPERYKELSEANDL